MESYSPEMERRVREQLAEASPEDFAALLAYYRRRGGPGLALAAAEAVVRDLNPATPGPFLPACKACLQRPEQCVC